MNPFFNRFGNQGQFQSGGMPGPFSNFSNMLKQYNVFKSAFRGDAYQQIQDMLNSGQMTQDQFNYCSQFANQFNQMAQQFQNMMM